jgi:hypothetical protein
MRKLISTLLVAFFILPLFISNASAMVVEETVHHCDGDVCVAGCCSHRNHRKNSLIRIDNKKVIPINWRNREFDPHWAGVGIGINNFADNNLRINHADGISLKVGRSLEYTFNFAETALPISKNFAFVTGLGLKWNRYHLSENEFFTKVDGVTVVLPAGEGINFTRTRLGVNSLTLPLLFEWQTKTQKNETFFISVGAVASVNYMSRSKVRYRNAERNQLRETVASNLNIRPVTVDLMTQAGFGNVGIYAKYSPNGLFDLNRGPEVNPVSVGLMLHF